MDSGRTTLTQDRIDELIDQVGRLKPHLDLSGLAVTGRILALASRLADRRAVVLSPLGVNLGEFDVLATVRRTGSSTAAEICQSVMITAGGMTKRLDRLETRGLLERRPDPDDRRVANIALTAEGLRLIDEAYELVMATEAQLILDELGDESQRSQLVALLRTLLISPELGASPRPSRQADPKDTQ